MSEVFSSEVSSSDLIVKGNSLIEACFDLTLVEYRILNLAFTAVLEEGNKEKEFEISAIEYAKIYNVSEKIVYKQLNDALKKLFNRKFSYKIKVIKKGIQDTEYKDSRWISNASYAEKIGYIKFQLTDDVIEMVGFLKECFTQYKLSQTASLNSVYAIRFYEMMVKWKGVGKTPVISISDLKKIMGISQEMYPRVIDLKRRVIEPSIKQINEFTDIYEAEVFYTKRSRSIVGLYFTFKFKKDAIEGESKEVKPLKKLTDKQIKIFSSKLSKLQEFQSVFESYPNESYSDFAERIAEKLTEAENVQKWAKYLEQVGFKC